ncbi:putative disease resistance protein RGA1 [Ziziphus jujuba]|uniref:Disease resistance protein RGA1 n=1 Tax=Ziziphus jujuba TaxID=326968 RepID=A0ABM3ZZW5_ZIZJJ|nr:putative disease resistance protein RGA1 [Ziziphus jujuba]
MAEAIFSGVVEAIIDNLASAAVQEIGLLWGFSNELEELENIVSAVKAVLLDAEEQRVHSNQVKNWLKRLRFAVYDADDLLDRLLTEALRRRVMPGNEFSQQVCTFFSTLKQLAFRLKMVHKMKDVRKKLAGIAANRKDFCLEERREETRVVSRVREQTHSFVPEEQVIGREKDRIAIVESLLDDKVDETLSIISIVGIGGLGKTALAQLVFNDEKVQQHFELKMWVCVSDVFDLKIIVENIIKSATNESPNNLEMDQLQYLLGRVLFGKQYLLVLDDVWNENRKKWLSLKNLLAHSEKGSRILITTRSKMVAEIISTVQPFQLGILDEENSWSLFEKMAFKEGKEETKNSNIVKTGMEIVKICRGIPLAIRTIGSMLYFKNPKTEWPSFSKKELFEISQEEDGGILPTLKLSYDHLPSHLKHCFAYCRLFPKYHKIDVQTLINLWMAQGFIKLKDSSQCPEDIGYEYFMDLLWRSFFQEVEKDEFDNVTTCKMHDLMHDLAISVAGSECTMLSLSHTNIDEGMRHVSFDCNIDSPQRISTLLNQAKRIRTILLPNQASPEGVVNLDEKIYHKAVIHFKFLRTLDLHFLDLKEVSDSIGKLRHLRYLDLSDNGEIKALPNSITELYNLQTLKLLRCCSLKELPRDTKKLINLRKLEIEGCIALEHMPHGLGKLTDLRTLSKFVLSDNVSRHIGELEELKTLNNLRGDLCISNLKPRMESKAANLKDKQHIQYLEFDWYDCADATDVVGYEMTLEDLQPHPNLEELTLLGYHGSRFSSWIPSLTNLVRFTLEGCKKCQHLPPLYQLPSLKVLELKRLLAVEYIFNNDDNNFLSSTSSLTSLKVVYLENLPNLKGWWRDADNQMLPSFPNCLSKLVIRDCPKLHSTPLTHTDVALVLKINSRTWKCTSLGLMNLHK